MFSHLNFCTSLLMEGNIEKYMRRLNEWTFLRNFVKLNIKINQLLYQPYHKPVVRTDHGQHKQPQFSQHVHHKSGEGKATAKTKPDPAQFRQCNSTTVEVTPKDDRFCRWTSTPCIHTTGTVIAHVRFKKCLLLKVQVVHFNATSA